MEFFITAQFISKVSELATLLKNSAPNKSHNEVVKVMGQAWEQTLSSLVIGLNPSFGAKIKLFVQGLIDRAKFNNKTIQEQYVAGQYFSNLNIDEKLRPVLRKQLHKLHQVKTSPFNNMKDDELINLLNSKQIEKHIVNFIQKYLANETELLSFLQEHNQDFFSAFKAHFFALAETNNTINTAMNMIQCQKLEKLDKNSQNLVDKRLRFYKMPVIARDEKTKGKTGKKKAFCYSQFGDFVLMAGSYVTINPTNSCQDNIKKLRTQYADSISENGLLSKNIHFNSSSAVASFIAYASVNGDSLKPTRKSKKFVINDDGEFVSCRKQPKK